MPEICVDDIIDTFTEHQELVATSRALRTIGEPYRWLPDGTIEIDSEPDEVVERQDFLDAFEQEFISMAVDKIFQGLIDRGAVIADGIYEDGTTRYVGASYGG